MKKLIITISALLIIILIFILGFYSGYYLSDYDVLCEKEYAPHKLTKEFKSKNGVSLPIGTIVYARGCKPNTDVRLEFYIDNWDYKEMERLESDPYPAYYFNVENNEK